MISAFEEMMESNILEIFYVVPGPAHYETIDDDKMEYCVLPPGPLIMVFILYLFLKQASPRNYVNWWGITDLDGQTKDLKPMFTLKG